MTQLVYLILNCLNLNVTHFIIIKLALCFCLDRLHIDIVRNKSNSFHFFSDLSVAISELDVHWHILFFSRITIELLSFTAHSDNSKEYRKANIYLAHCSTISRVKLSCSKSNREKKLFISLQYDIKLTFASETMCLKVYIFFHSPPPSSLSALISHHCVVVELLYSTLLMKTKQHIYSNNWSCHESWMKRQKKFSCWMK